jgi:cell division protein ZapA
MSDERVSRVSVRLLDREYQVACPAEERADLLDSAEFLDGKMREVRDSGKVVGLDRIAVISALNLANELIKLRRHGTALDGDVGARLQRLRERVEAALERGQQMEL